MTGLPRPAQSMAQALALVLALLLIVQCGLIAAAAGHAALGTARAERWTDGADMMATWHDVHRRLALAVRLDPLTARYRSALGRLSEQAAAQDGVQDAEGRVDHLRQAAEAYAAALELTPGDGIVWARQARVALALQRRAEAEAALTKAAQLAPWEPEAQLVVTSVGVSGWLWLSPAAREQVLTMAGNGLVHASAHRQGELRRLLATAGFLGMVCDHLEYRGQESASCPR